MWKHVSCKQTDWTHDNTGGKEVCELRARSSCLGVALHAGLERVLRHSAVLTSLFSPFKTRCHSTGGQVTPEVQILMLRLRCKAMLNHSNTHSDPSICLFSVKDASHPPGGSSL